MITKSVFLFFGLAVSMCLISAEETVAQMRIRFARGSISAVVSGSLNGYRDKRGYILKVRAGQTLNTEKVGNRYITIFVRDPNGRIVGDSDASCNDRREIRPTIAGDYHIEAVECRKADPWRGRFRFRVTVL